MKRSFILLILFFQSIYFTEAQNIWQGYGELLGTACLQAYDGNYVFFGGIVTIGAGSTDFCLAKTDSLGNVMWSKAYGGTGSDEPVSLRQASDSGFIMLGSTMSFGGRKIYLIKTDSYGNLVWSKTYVSPGSGGFAFDLEQINSGGYIILSDLHVQLSDIFLIRLDVNGDTVWTKKIGATGEDKANCIKQTYDNGFIIGGGTTSFGNSFEKGYLIKTDSLGNVMWSKTFGGSVVEEFKSIEITSDSGFIISGLEGIFGVDSLDFYVVRTNKNGDSLWTKRYGGSNWEYCKSLEKTSDGGFILSGYSWNNIDQNAIIYIVRINYAGDTLWTKSYEYDISGNNTIWGCSSTTDRGYIFTGITGENGFFMKTDSSGNSGCNEITFLTTYGSTPTQVDSPFSVSIVSNVIVDSPPTMVTIGWRNFNVLCSSVRIPEFPYDVFFLAPNPAFTKCTITSSQSAIKSISIFNLLGEKESVWEYPVGKKEITIDVSYFASGIYFIQVQTESGSLTQKLIKQ